MRSASLFDADECRLHTFSTFYTCKALGHALHQLILRETAQKGVLAPVYETPPRIRFGDEAGGQRNDD